MEDKNVQTGDNFVIEVTAMENETQKDVVLEAIEESNINQNTIVDKEETMTAEEIRIVHEAMGGTVEEINEETASLGDMAKNILGGFMNFIQGDDFDDKCEAKATEYGVNSTIVKNAFIRNTLGSIANALNLTIHVAGDIVKGAVSFISNILSTIVNFGAATLHKLITVVTLNCGTVQY